MQVYGQLKSAQLEKLTADPVTNVVEGRIYFNTVSNKAKVYDGSSWVEVGSGGSGAGELNFVTNPNDTNAAWSSTGAGMTVATTTTAAELPLNGVPGYTTGIKITNVSGTTNEVHLDFDIPAGYRGLRQKLQFDQLAEAGYGAADTTVDVKSYSNVGRTTDEVTYPLTTDTAGVTYLPTDTRQFQVQFQSDSRQYYRAVFKRAAGTKYVVLENVVVGPGVAPYGSTVTGSASWTPTGTWLTNATYTGKFWQTANRLGASIRIDLTGVPTTANLSINLPSGLSIDESGYAAASGSVHYFGDVFIFDTSSSDRFPGKVTAIQGTTGSLSIRVPGQSLNTVTTIDRGTTIVTQAVPMTFASGDYITIEIRDLPITEWANAAVRYTPTVKQSPIRAGFIAPFAGGTIPSGWLACDGTAYAQTLYPDLYATLGSTWDLATNPTTALAYTSPGAGNFRVPDLRGVFLRGSGTPSGLSAVALAGYQSDQNLSHTHTATGTVSYSTVAYTSGTARAMAAQTPTSGTIALASATVDASGSTEARPRNVGVTYIVKVWNDSVDLVGIGTASSILSGLTSTYTPAARSSVLSQSGNYQILDTDGYDTILVTAGVSSDTITPPSAANNPGRKIRIIKVDTGVGGVIVGGAVSGVTSNTINRINVINGSCEIVSTGTEWVWAQEISENQYASTHTSGGLSNCTVSTGFGHWSRVGRIVTGSWLAVVTITTTGTDASFTFTAPWATANYGSAQDVAGNGVATQNSTAKDIAIVQATSGAQTLSVLIRRPTAASASAETFIFTWTGSIQ